MSSYNTKYGFEKISGIIGGGVPHIHFCGAGGVGVYSLVRLSLARGFRVSATDACEGEYTKRLSALGVRVSYGPDLSSVSASSLVVYSLAVDSLDAELVHALALGIPRVSRADYLSYLMEEYKSKIAVSGTHGKSTVTAMISAIFTAAGISPTTVSGAELPSGEPYILGEDNAFIYEACEYRDSFLCMTPSFSAVTNIEYDHPDYFKDVRAVRESFLTAVNNTRQLAVLPALDKNIREIISRVSVPYVTWGTTSADYEYAISSITPRGCEFVLSHGGAREGFSLSTIGAHNVANAVCASAVALEYGIGAPYIREALSCFELPKRRLEYIGDFSGRPIIYDYAHHPTEIAAAIAAVGGWLGDRVTVIFAPHTYSRTKALWDGFIRSLSLADYVILTEIYPAREEPIAGVSSERLAAAIGERAAFATPDGIIPALLKTRGVIILMGAGEVSSIREKMVKGVEE